MAIKIVNGVEVTLTSEEVAAENAKDTAWANEELNRRMIVIRQIRNAKLLETDYLALSDQTLSTAMATYRTNLRNFPATISDVADARSALTQDSDGSYKNFPTKPSE